VKRAYTYASFAVTAAFAARSALDARREGDRLKLVDAVASTAAALTGLLLVLRDLREEIED
jgi:predicted nucleic acid-binding protein